MAGNMVNRNLLVKKFSAATVANFIVLLISLFSTLVFPKVLSVEDYSYWQLYIFYTGFVTIAGFGWVEGIYLKNGGKKYKELETSIYAFQTYGLFTLVSFVFLIISIIVCVAITDKKMMFVLMLVCVEGIIFNVRVYPLYILQTTDRIKEFALAIVIGRGSFLFTSLVVLLCGNTNLYFLIFSDIFGCICCSIYAFFQCRDKLLGKPCNVSRGVIEVKNNISTGFSLMLANMVGIGITGVIKCAVQTYWSVVEFGKISFSLTCTNLFLKFTNAIGTVIFPMLCNSSIDKMKKIYNSMNTLLEYIIAIAMFFYYPLKLILIMYLPHYAESLEYMGYLLPICLFETKVSLIFNTYYKALRKEKTLMIVNIVDLGISLIFAILVTRILSSLQLAVFSILIVLAIRSLVLERILCKKYLQLETRHSGLFSCLIACIFVMANGYIGGWYGMLIYGLVLLSVGMLDFQRIRSCKKILKGRKHG